MHLNAKLPVLMPPDYWKEFEKLSKAALLDLAWDYATRCAGEPDTELILAELRQSAATIVRERSQQCTSKS